jgi:hypothetical protein
MSKYFRIRNIDEDLINKVQRAGVEVDGRMNIINYLMSDHKDDPSFLDSALFQHYHEQYFDSNTTFNLYKQEIQNTIPQLVALKQYNFNWNLDYSAKEIEIELISDVPIDAEKLGLEEIDPSHCVLCKK